MNELKRTGSPKELIFGYLGVLLFVMGDGIEQTWLSAYMYGKGVDSAILYSVYGIAVAASSWLSGVIAETFGIKKTMLTGYLLYVIGALGFSLWGISSMNIPVLLTTYAVRGLGYPLFAYTFVVWITYRVEKGKLSSAQGWFWFIFTGGLNVLGAQFGIFAKNAFGVVPALASAAIFASAGALLALLVNKAGSENLFAGEQEQRKGNPIKELLKGLAIVGREPKILMGGIVRTINTTSQYAFVVFMPLYMMEHGVLEADWALVWSSIFIANIIFNLIFGIVGDKLGWSRTVAWFGGIGCAITVLLFYYSPQICNNLWFILLCGALWCITLAGYVPLSALVPSLVSRDKGAAVSVLNLGAGLSVVLGPLLVKILKEPFGYSGIVWTMAALYIVSAILTSIIGKASGK